MKMHLDCVGNKIALIVLARLFRAHAATVFYAYIKHQNLSDISNIYIQYVNNNFLCLNNKTVNFKLVFNTHGIPIFINFYFVFGIFF